MAYLVVAEVADHTVRKPLVFHSQEAAVIHLHELARLGAQDGYAAKVSAWDADNVNLILRDRASGEVLETYRIIETDDEKVLRMSHPAPPTSYTPPRLP